ncbi:unnamed protein product [Chironomus riparius]|uniref:Uncharacterized protein n=1 Tax=Chironomus riparius TaxID=315576 RepID=A0A9N9RIU4_9DIPT|nr:unnamed protein product [Chironomus riparius]
MSNIKFNFQFLRSLNKLLKVLWIMILTFGLFYCIISSYLKWQIYPDIAQSTKLKPASEIPFPAVTICTTAFDYRIQDLTNVQYIAEDFYDHFSIMELTIEQQNYLQLFYHTCRPELYTDDVITKLLPNRTEKNVLKLLYDVLDPMQYNFCQFKGIMIRCDLLYSRTFTDYGACETYNWQGHDVVFKQEIVSENYTIFKSNDISEYPVTNIMLRSKNGKKKQRKRIRNNKIYWSLEDGYLTEKEEVWPVRAERKHFVTFNIRWSNDYQVDFCASTGGGFIFMLHLPSEMPTTIHEKYFVGFNDDKKVMVTAKSYKTRENLRHLNPHKRQCYFPGEKPLKFFKTYTKAHCEYECMTNYTLNKCGCVKFSMPHTKVTPICDLEKVYCYYNATQNWPDRNDEHFKIPCECYPPCSNIEYSVQSERTGKSVTFMEKDDK